MMTKLKVRPRSIHGLLACIVGIPLAGCERADSRFVGTSEKELVNVYIASVLKDDTATADATICELYRRGEPALPALEEAAAKNQRAIDEGQRNGNRMAAFVGAGSAEVQQADHELTRIRQVGLNLLVHKTAISKGHKQPKLAVVPLPG